MKQDARKLSPQAQEALRRRAVQAVRNGMVQRKAAETFGVALKTISIWMKTWREKGDEGLAAHKRGPKSGGKKLLGWQAATIVNLITDRHPEQLKLPFVLWTADGVRQLIQRQFKLRLSARTVRRYLRSWGFTPQKPTRRAYERDEAEVKRWLVEEYPAIRERAGREKARIYWGDEMGARSDHQAGRSWAPRGHTPTTPGTGKRFRCNMISAITNRGDLAFMIFKRSFNMTVFLQFLRRLVRHAGRKVFFIVDRHPVHLGKKVREWLETKTDRIEVFFMPGYSPELNPDEMLNQDVKANAVGRKRARDRKALMRNLRAYLTKRRNNPDLVKHYFHEESVRYAAR
jgi:transposase